MANRWVNSGNSGRFYFGGLQNHCRWWLQPWNKKTFTPWKESYYRSRQHIKKQRYHFANKVHLVKAMVFPVVMNGCDNWTVKKTECQRIDAFELWCWRRLWESLELQRAPTSPSQRISVLNIHWKDWCWNWNSNTLATWSRELTHLNRPWCLERLKAGGEGDDRGWDGLMASRLNGHEFG